MLGPGIWRMNSKRDVKQSTMRNVFLHSKTAEVMEFEKKLIKAKSEQNLRRRLHEHETNRERWKKKNPDYKKKKYVIYI